MNKPDAPFLFDPPELVRIANQCVACGLCLPHCPTYRKTLSEADSPRGRIFMMRSVLEGRVPLSDTFAGHIDLCLSCRRCELVCPSRVEYGKLAEGMRAYLNAHRSLPAGKRWRRDRLLALAASPKQVKLAGTLLKLWQHLGLRHVAKGLLERFGAAKLEAALPRVKDGWQGVRSASGQRGEVGLFLGCVARFADSETLKATAFVLEKLGYGVRVPPTQTCCGALHRHAGEPGQAADLDRRNREAFAGLDTVIVAATGCAPALKEALAPAGIAVREATEFLAHAEGWENAQLAPLNAKVAVHEPCSQANVLRDTASPYVLLKRIPGAGIVPLPGNDQCCGGAGAYFLLQPRMANALLDDKIRAIEDIAPRFIATANLGCALHMGCGAKDRGLETELLHPVTLVARQMGFKD